MTCDSSEFKRLARTLGGMAVAVGLAGCATAMNEDAVPRSASAQASPGAVQGANGLPPLPPARTTGRVPEYPNLAVTRRTAAPQFSDEERASSAEALRERRTSLADAASDPIRDQADFLREIGRTHGDETLRQIEDR